MIDRRRFEDALVDYARSPSRRGFLRLLAGAVTMTVTGGTAAMLAPPAAADAAPHCLVEYPPADLGNCPNKRHHPGHSPTTNGCGPEGKYLNRAIPNSWGKADFKPSCDKHDVCYGTCGTNKDVCDANLALGAVDACEAAYGGGGVVNATKLAACRTVAYDYGAAVSLGGDGAFEEAQKEDCECCHPIRQVYCGPLDACYESAHDCLDVCPSGLGVFAEELCGPPPKGKCGT